MLVLDRLREAGCAPKRTAKGWSACCPAHEDRHPSLSIDVGKDGCAVLCCHAGCSNDSVCKALGLTLAELFVPVTRTPGTPGSPNGSHVADGTRGSSRVVVPGTAGNSRDTSRGGGGTTFASAGDAIAFLERRLGPRARTWTYTDAHGEPLGLIVRWDNPDGSKRDVRPVSREGDRWRLGGMPRPRPLYGLPDVLASPPGSRVYVTEGEKAADAARAIGLLATTSPHGSQSARTADWSALRGRDVVILPDHDEPGERYAREVAELARREGAMSVRIVRLHKAWAEMPKGGDMADFVEHVGGDADRARKEIEAMVEGAERVAEVNAIEAMAEDDPMSFEPFPTHVLPEPIQSFVRRGAISICCDESYLAVPLLAGLAGAIGNTCRIRIKPEWSEPAIVWAAIVGESGTAKSPALELALRPLRRRQQEAMRRHAEEMKAHEAAMAVHERDRSAWNRSKSSSPPPEKPQAPVVERCWTDDATTEAIAVLLQQNPRGLLMIRDELSGWFNFDRYAGGKGGGDVAKWLEMYGGRTLVVDRKGGGTLYVPRAAVSIAGGIQPEILRRALGLEHRENGLAARMLLACPPRKPKQWTDADIGETVMHHMKALFDRLFGLRADTDDAGESVPRFLEMDEGAKARWRRFYDEHAKEMATLPGDAAAAWSKLEGYAARIALIIHLARVAADNPTLPDAERIDVVSLEAAITLVRWFGREALRVYGLLDESDQQRGARRLVEWVARQGGVVSVRQLTKGIREYRNDRNRAEAALEGLVKRGVGNWEEATRGALGGRPVRRFRLVGAVPVPTTPKILGNSRGSGDGDTGDASPDDGWGTL